MGSLGKREKILLGVLTAIIVFYGYFTLFLSPEINKMNELSRSISKSKIQVNKIRNAKQIIKNQTAQIEELKDSINLAFKAIPESGRNPEITYNMKKLADQSNVSFSTIKFAKIINYDTLKDKTDGKENGKNTNEKKQQNTTTKSNEKTTSIKKLYIIPAMITTEGDYTSTMKFIDSIENDSRISAVRSIDMVYDEKTAKIKSNTSVYMFYSDKISEDELDYEFNQGIYGKGDLFK